MTIPQVAYRFRGALQSVPSSEWTLSAAVSALASARANLPLSGQANGKDLLEAWLLTQDVPLERARLWANSINGQRVDFSESIIPTLNLPLVPDPYQIQSVKSLSIGGGTLAFRCGLGKTLSAMLWAMASGRTGRCWIVAPVNAFQAWQKYLPLLRQRFSDVRIISVDLLHKIAPATAATGGIVIFDEAHKLGGVGARRTKNALILRSRFDCALCLTATLSHAGLVRTLPVLQLAVPGLAGFASSWKAADHFHCIERGPHGSKINKPTGAHHEAFLEYLSSRFVISLAYSSPTVLASIQVPEQDIVTLSTGDIEAPIEPLAQAYVSGRLAEGVGIPTAQETIHAICQAGAEEKVAYLTTQLTEPMVWFARYHATLDVCESALEEASIPYRRVDGSTSAQARAEAVEWFQSGTGPRVFLGQIDAAGISADLFAAQRSYTLDLSWQPESYDQALGRTRRRGQLLRCTHTDLIHNKLQQVVLTRLREGKSFDASVTEYQDLKRAMATFIPTGGTTHE